MFPITARQVERETGLPIKRCEQIVSQASGGKRIGRNYVATREDIAAVLHLHIHEGETEEGRAMGSPTDDSREAAERLRALRRGRADKRPVEAKTSPDRGRKLTVIPGGADSEGVRHA